MINTNLNLDKLEAFRLRPMKLQPVISHTEEEIWECSVHPSALTKVSNGIYEGRTLKEVLHHNPGFLGTHRQFKSGLPVVVKRIDAKHDLPLQVHPDDHYAEAHEGKPGKMEMWYVLDAVPGARVAYGFEKELSEEELKNGINSEQLLDSLQYIPVQKGDVFLVKPGVVHSIGKGIQLIGIHEFSDLTYRIYDYGQTDKKGNPYQLDITKALEVMNRLVKPEVRPKMRLSCFKPGGYSQLLCRCEHFQVDKLTTKGTYSISVGPNSFCILMCIGGEGAIVHKEYSFPVSESDCIFIPANSGEIKLCGNLETLKVGC